MADAAAPSPLSAEEIDRITDRWSLVLANPADYLPFAQSSAEDVAKLLAALASAETRAAEAEAERNRLQDAVDSLSVDLRDCEARNGR